MIQFISLSFIVLTAILGCHKGAISVNYDALKSLFWTSLEWVDYVFGTYLAHHLITLIFSKPYKARHK